MNNEEIKAEKPNNAEANKKAEETKVTVNVNEGSSWLKPTLYVVGGIVVGALGALGVKWFMDRDSGDAATVDTTADA